MKYYLKKTIILGLYLFTAFLSVKANQIKLTIKFDGNASETSWVIKNAKNTTVASGGPYTSNFNDQIYNETITLSPGQNYTFIISDAGGNGICCHNGEGHYSLVDEYGHSLVAGGPFESSESASFSVTANLPQTFNVKFSSPQTIFVPDPNVPWYFNPEDFSVTSEGDILLAPSNGDNYTANVEGNENTEYAKCLTPDRFDQEKALSKNCNVKALETSPAERSFYGTNIPISGATITFWVKLDWHINNNIFLGANISVASNKVFEFGVDESAFYFEQKYKSENTDNGIYRYTLAEPFSLDDLDKWYFVSMIFDGFYTRVYIAEKSTGDFKCHYWWDGFNNHPDWEATTSWQWLFNAYNQSNSDLDDVMVWYGHKLSKTQIDALFECQKKGSAADCLGDIPMPSATTVSIAKRVELVDEQIDEEEMITREKEGGLRIYPNPVSNEFKADFYLPYEGKVQLQLLDISGRLLMNKEGNLQSGFNQVHVQNVRASCGCNQSGQPLFFKVTGKGINEVKKIILK